MTEENPIIVPDTSGEQQPSASLGERLRTAREQLGLDIDDVSRQLCLSPRQVTALESNAFDVLPSPTFARGFIRNYAKLLQLDAESLLALYRVNAPDTSANASISLHSEGIPIQTGNRSAWLPYLLASVLLILAGGGWWLYMDWRDNHPAQSSESGKADKPAQPLLAPQAANEQQAEPPPMGAGLQTEQLVQPPVPIAPPVVSAPTAPTAPIPVQASAAGRIVMKFTQPSWVRVQDGDGKELFNKNKPANSEETVEGKPPLKLEIGNVTGAQITYNGQPVDLAPHTKTNVARLTLE